MKISEKLFEIHEFQENTFEKDVCKMAVILSQPKCVEVWSTFMDTLYGISCYTHPVLMGLACAVLGIYIPLV